MRAGRGNRSRVARAAPAPLVIAMVVAVVVRGAGAASAAEVADAGPPRVIAVEPGRDRGLLVCRLATAGLPGERLVSSMRSGLVSAIDVDLELLDARERVVGDSRLTLRLAFDLWEEVFAVETDGERRRFPDLAALEAFLADLRALPIAPLPALARDGRLRVRAGIALHPVAPSELARVGEVIGAATPDDGRGGGGQEVSVSLGRLIRLFYRRGDRPAPAAEGLSGWFTPEELPDAPH